MHVEQLNAVVAFMMNSKSIGDIYNHDDDLCCHILRNHSYLSHILTYEPNLMDLSIKKTYIGETFLEISV